MTPDEMRAKGAEWLREAAQVAEGPNSLHASTVGLIGSLWEIGAELREGLDKFTEAIENASPEQQPVHKVPPDDLNKMRIDELWRVVGEYFESIDGTDDDSMQAARALYGAVRKLSDKIDSLGVAP